MVVKKQLGADVVGTLIDFRLEVIHFQQAVRGVRVTFRECRYTDSKATRIRVLSSFVACSDVANEVGGVLEGILGAVISGVTCWRIASQGEDITNAGISVALQCRSDFIFAV